MDFLINSTELEALYGLPHAQQLAYLRGIRPYMDGKTGIVGIKRGISYQSIAEQLYIEPHQGIKSENFSRMQVRRALSALVRAGLISVHSEEKKLILKCELASRPYSVQNKADPKQTQQLDPVNNSSKPVNTRIFEGNFEKADSSKTPKADTPLYNNYLYLLFAKFWESYPQKKSKQAAWEAFQAINPNDRLVEKILNALKTQITHCTHMQQQGHWVAPWKYPANWLLQQCWEDEINTNFVTEKVYAERKKPNSRADTPKPMFWVPEDGEEDERLTHSNVIAFK